MKEQFLFDPAGNLSPAEVIKKFCRALAQTGQVEADWQSLGFTPQCLASALQDLLAGRLLPPDDPACSRQNLFPHSQAGDLILYTDGAARGNPGPAGAGILLQDEQGQTVSAQCRFLGRATNNVAEYQALLLGLEAALPHNPRHLIIRMDSELLVRQLQGRYKVKSPLLLPLFYKAQALLKQFKAIDVNHVPRHMNAEADALANKAIDEAGPA